ncbi:MAG: hypothetical protein PHW66_06065 [Gallionella sp.]|jgi:hypothetical protein|nr:hypothetical protein [Gallionella sp.]
MSQENYSTMRKTNNLCGGCGMPRASATTPCPYCKEFLRKAERRLFLVFLALGGLGFAVYFLNAFPVQSL